MYIVKCYSYTKNDEKLKGFVIDFENPLESDSGNYCMDLETDLGFILLMNQILKTYK